MEDPQRSSPCGRVEPINNRKKNPSPHMLWCG